MNLSGLLQISVVLSASFYAVADIYADTVPSYSGRKDIRLQEVVVEADNRKEIPGGVAFYPEKRDKKFAVDAMSLLEAMALTELPYDVMM